MEFTGYGLRGQTIYAIPTFAEIVWPDGYLSVNKPMLSIICNDGGKNERKCFQ